MQSLAKGSVQCDRLPLAVYVDSRIYEVSIASCQTMADAAVRETDNDAAVSRLSAVRKGHLHDDFAAFFVKRPSTRPPLINIGTYLRTWSIDRLVDAFLAGEGSRQIVSLGAGTDTRFFRLASNAQQSSRIAKYVEVDFPEATTKKAMIIRKQNKLAELLKEPVSLGTLSSAATRYDGKVSC